MKKNILLAAAMMMSFAAFSQDVIERYFKEMNNDEQVTKVSISSKMFELFMHIDSEEESEKELLETVSKLKGMKILIKEEVANGEQLYKSAIKKPNADYEVLMTVEDDDEDLTFFIREENGVIAELVMIAGGKDNFVLLSLIGEIDLNQISKLSKSMNIEGMDNLEKIEQR
ncbi:MAG: DUF4252 domain-containing protein [Bacteroidetes bacterium]|nr:DUF4252 domain-containing protein [Bacteroidota bacterium]